MRIKNAGHRVVRAGPLVVGCGPFLIGVSYLASPCIIFGDVVRSVARIGDD